MSHQLENKTVLIFGASKGIGLACAKAFAEIGAVVVLAARSAQRIQAEAEAIVNSGGRAYAVECDVSDYQSVNRAVEFCTQSLGALDIVVNNAGVIEPLSFLIDSDPDLWSEAVDINVKGVYHAIRTSAPHLSKQGHGVIVNLSSGAANSILEGWSHYCSTKSAVKKLTEVAHKELHDVGIRVVGLSPGTVATSMMEKIRDSKLNAVSELKWDSHIPASWAAKAVVFLCGPGGEEFAGTDFSIKTDAGRKLVGLPSLSE